MSLQKWYQNAYRLNQTASRRCPRRLPCSEGDFNAVYEYVTGKEGRAIVLRCLQCGALKHLEMSMGRESFSAIWSGTGRPPTPDRLVHLPVAGRPRLKRSHHRKQEDDTHE